MLGDANRQGDPVSPTRSRIGVCWWTPVSSLEDLGRRGPQWIGLPKKPFTEASTVCLCYCLCLPMLFLPGGESNVAQLTSLSQVLNWPSWLEKHSPGLTALPAISTNARPSWGIQQARPHAQCHEAFCLIQDMVQRYKRADLIAELLRINIYKYQWCLLGNERNMSGAGSPPAMPESPR